jgi:hypothetical protein
VTSSLLEKWKLNELNINAIDWCQFAYM